jgi:Fe-S-cluster containining protein
MAEWYADGLKFSCTQCGKCCTGAPGFVWISEDECDAMAQRLGLEPVAFRRRYTRLVHRKGQQFRSLVEQANHDCIFWRKGVGCTVYEQRPQQCRTWPFWRSTMRSQEDWDAEAEECPGMNRGELHDAASISATVANDGLAFPG